MNPIGILVTLLLVGLTIGLPRKFAPVAVLMGACYITQGQQLNVAGFHMTSMRFILLAGIIRVFSRGELAAIKFNMIDRAVVTYIITRFTVYVVGRASVEALVYQLGTAYNITLTFFVFRALFQTYEEVEEFVSMIAFVVVPPALLMVFESQTGRNLLFIFGGVGPYDEYRDGHYRCCGAFRSPITGGTFGMTLFPLFVGLYQGGKYRFRSMVGMAATVAITICSRSSGPLLSFGAVTLALCFWRFRYYAKLFRRAFAIGLVFMHMIMKAPVWFLIGHMSDVVGGGGWHRAEIIDAAVRNMGDWWLSGTDNTGGWVGTELVFGGADITNEFVSVGITGGLISLVFFIVIFVRVFRYVGISVQQSYQESPAIAKLVWALGAALLGTVVNFFSVSYFDQIEVIWYMVLVLTAVATFNIMYERPIMEVHEDEAPEHRGNDFALGRPDLAS